MCFFFFKQKTAYEMRISDWSSDVCSSDLPIAKVAAKLAVGYTLDELKNEITGGLTPASFEPSIDYVVTKIPRFAFEKFPAADARLTTQMKSVGEVMAIGRSFQESLQKALRGLETGQVGLDPTGLDLDDGGDLGVGRASCRERGGREKVGWMLVQSKKK